MKVPNPRIESRSCPADVVDLRARRDQLAEAANSEPGAIWSPPPLLQVITIDQALHVPIGTLPAEIEKKLVATPIDPSESHAAGGARRETELRAQLATLDLPQSFHLKRRLEGNRAGDPLCAAIQRIVAGRRQRLPAFVGDARRRIAMGGR